MDNDNQVNKLCGFRGNERVYNDYHRIYNPCRICAAKKSARYNQAKKDKIIARFNLFQENTKMLGNIIHNK